jgi:CRP-like cAMP-binding protein
MEDSLLREIPADKFLSHLAKYSLLEGFARYLAERIADQQQVITSLMTVDSEHRLGEMLLRLARRFGKNDARSIRIDLNVSHGELAAMVGANQPRISMFMRRFQKLGLIESDDRHLIIKEQKLAAYLASSA